MLSTMSLRGNAPPGSSLVLAFMVMTAACGGADDPEPPLLTSADASASRQPPSDADRFDAGSPEADAGAPEGGPPTEGANDCPRAIVAVPPGSNLNVRETPSTTADVVASLPNNAFVDVLARVTGESVSGTSEWLKIGAKPKDGFVSAAYATCTTKQAPVLKAMKYHLPLECGKSSTISQGNDGGFSHQGKALYAYDFSVPVGTPLTAMADGIVLYTFDETGPGDRCYNGGGSECFPYANYVVLRHGDGTGSIYKHLSKVLVSIGEFVPSGKAVGLSGSTGYSTGPHAHVMRQDICGSATSCQSLKTPFEDVPGNGIPATGQKVTSDNGCPH